MLVLELQNDLHAHLNATSHEGEIREKRFAPPPLLKRMVKAGLYGRKSGRGFYDYADPKKPVPMNLV